MAGWPHHPGVFRQEAHYGDRVVAARIDRPHSLTGMLRAAVARNPSGEALVCGSFRASWTELEEMVEACARGLVHRGLGDGDRAILFLGNRPEYVILLHAIVRIGAVAVPVGIREQAPGLAYMAGQSGASLILHEPALSDRLPEALTAIAVPEGDPRGFIAAFDAAGQALPQAEPEEQGAALIMYTSGTTGRPKGAIATHLGIAHVAMGYVDCMALGSADRSACVVPLSHITGISLLATMAAAAGTLIVVPQFDARTFAAHAAAERMTHTLMVPAMYNLLLARTDLASFDLSHWRVGAFGGAPMPLATIEHLHRLLPDLGLMNCYGSTETGGGVVVMPADRAAMHSDAVGWPVPGATILVMDEHGHQLPPGEVGELWIGAAAVTPGYWNDPEATRAGIVGGYWRSGDVGSVDGAGCVRVLDRMKDMINRGGYKIYGAEVEDVLSQHPAVLEAAVVGRPCPILGERVHAFVSLRDGAAITAEALKAHCATRLADYKQPEDYAVSRDPLPRNLNGKILKNELRKLAEKGAAAL